MNKRQAKKQAKKKQKEAQELLRYVKENCPDAFENFQNALIEFSVCLCKSLAKYIYIISDALKEFADELNEDAGE